MAKYEKLNEKSGRLFATKAEKLQQNPKLPNLNGSIVIDGVLVYVGIWKRTSQKTGNTYFTMELTYPNDEDARLKADGPATSEAAAKERKYDEENPRTKEHAKSAWKARANDESANRNGAIDPDDMPF